MRSALDRALRETPDYERLESLLKKGGTLVYSTCTVTDTENSLVTGRFISNNEGFVIESEKQMGPDEGTDGFYICRIKREA